MLEADSARTVIVAKQQVHFRPAPGRFAEAAASTCPSAAAILVTVRECECATKHTARGHPLKELLKEN